MRQYGNRVGPSSKVAGALRRGTETHTGEKPYEETRRGRGGLTLAGFRGNRTLPHLDF